MNPYLYYLIISIGILVLSFFSAQYAEKIFDKQAQTHEETVERYKNAAKIFSIGLFFNAIWVFICLYSTNLIFDSIVYDTLVTVFYTASLIFMGMGVALTMTNYIGLTLIIIGLTLMRI